MKAVRFSSAAKTELDDAVETYEIVAPGVGVAFRLVVESANADIAGNLLSYARYPGTLCHQCVLPKRFPYSVIYLETPTIIRIIAVAHHSRRPGYWKKRLRRP